MNKALCEVGASREYLAATERLYALDMLRGFCAIGVAAYHYALWGSTELPYEIYELLRIFGIYGVSTFFVLSGYSLAHAYSGRFEKSIEAVSLLAYARRRFARLAPFFCAVVFISVFAKTYLLEKTVDPLEVLGNATLLFGFIDPTSTPVIGGWSIGIEVVFYLLLPLVLLLRRRPTVFLLSALLMMLWLTFRLAQYESLEQGWTIYVHPANHWLFFLGGAYLCIYRDRLPRFGNVVRGLTLTAVVCAFALSVGSELELTTGWRRAALVPATLTTVALAASWRISSGRFIRLSVFMGGASYTLYMLHPLIYFGLKNHVDVARPIIWVTVLVLASFIAVLADRFVDAPLQHTLKSRGW
ncbi:acyltransferase family protein [Chitinimonas taiwanensis]|uniref:Peptidoglycan/LPS O-acetylase OafA/YrhL, contains acyltransferase and SGNH-hydrolase domains n=1 Tax=Chitinimonas taiwanensis DSM 18899 TaxID=1121279 RepID=A0A1K2HQ04_9NEIS|nr:acyltransferase [Chitinimonas taiwanensis]SFZ78888.1 Peptidoglycan/LPS O-acetylase OafA/YrhL, contains acyltransferase and SGNH-hydrolase domains [Chitinimonas taiwanensis DSM 18899]